MKNKLKLGQRIFFVNEKLTMDIKAIGTRFAICTRKLHRVDDAKLLHKLVNNHAYATFNEAYNDLKNEMVYSCLDFELQLKAPHNLIFNWYDLSKQEDIDELLEDLESGNVYLSLRNSVPLEIDDKTYDLIS